VAGVFRKHWNLSRNFAFASKVMWSDDCRSSTCGHLSRF
jgi:hypothetical protein